MVVKKVFISPISLNPKALNIAFKDDEYKLIHELCKGVIFIGTPHRGSALARPLSRVLSMTFSGKKFVPELQPGSTSITEISSDFARHSRHMHLVSFYEARGIHIVGVFSSESQAK